MADWREWELDEIPEWPATAQHIVLAALASVALVAGLFFFVLPVSDSIAATKAEEIGLKTVFRTKAQKVAALPDVDEQLDQLKAQYQQLARQLPAEEELAPLLAGINDTGVRHGLQFQRVAWRKPEKAGWLYQIPLDLKIKGRYADIGHFAAEMAYLPRILALQDFELTRLPSTTGTGPLLLSVTAHTYRFIEQEAR